ncbi:50S ribosomal protein L10 [Candidatus Woesearchaeota archaeon]|nr:MAG: 50S ribosomal protein L10 [Candidatus Woesearchaeota archaeon]
MKKMAHVAPYKKKIVAEFEKEMLNHKVVGVVDMENLPARTVQKMREQLRGQTKIKMTKKRLMKIALENVKAKRPQIEKLAEHFRGMPAMIFTNENPFKLFQTLQKNKTPAPAKAGQTAPKDIVIPAGPTPFSPGPVIGELGSFGIKTAIEGGKVAVKEDTVVAKEGDVINEKLAGLLTRLGIEPMEIGLNITAVWEDGTIFPKSVLDIDVEQYAEDLRRSAREAFNLAFNAGYPTTETTTFLVQKAFTDARALSINSGYPTSDTVKDIIKKAAIEALALQNKAGVSA